MKKNQPQNRKQQLAVREDEQGLTVALATQDLPLPPPEYLEKYMQLLPDSGERLLRITEKNQETIRVVTLGELSSNNRVHIQRFIIALCGIVLAGILGVLGVEAWAVGATSCASLGVCIPWLFRKQ